MSNHTTHDEEKSSHVKQIQDVQIENLALSEKVASDTNSICEEEDTDIQIVNELSTMEDDPTLPCFTLRVLVTGVVSSYIESRRIRTIAMCISNIE